MSPTRLQPGYKLIVALLLLPALVAPVAAQLVALSVRPEHASYVVGEPVLAEVRLENHGTQPLVISNHEAFRNNRIFFQIRNQPHEYLPQLNQELIVTDIDLELGEASTFKVDLGEWYPLLNVGRYYLNLVLIHNERRYVSDEQVLDIVPGIEIAGLTQSLRATQGVERRFTLVYWARGEREDLFLRIIDSPDNITWTTMCLGPIIRVTRPTIKLLDETTLSIFHQATRDSLITSTIRSDSEGPLLIDQKTRLDAASSPMINSLGDALERSKEKRSKKRR